MELEELQPLNVVDAEEEDEDSVSSDGATSLLVQVSSCTVSMIPNTLQSKTNTRLLTLQACWPARVAASTKYQASGRLENVLAPCVCFRTCFARDRFKCEMVHENPCYYQSSQAKAAI